MLTIHTIEIYSIYITKVLVRIGFFYKKESSFSTSFHLLYVCLHVLLALTIRVETKKQLNC